MRARKDLRKAVRCLPLSLLGDTLRAHAAAGCCSAPAHEQGPALRRRADVEPALVGAVMTHALGVFLERVGWALEQRSIRVFHEPEDGVLFDERPRGDEDTLERLVREAPAPLLRCVAAKLGLNPWIVADTLEQLQDIVLDEAAIEGAADWLGRLPPELVGKLYAALCGVASQQQQLCTATALSPAPRDEMERAVVAAVFGLALDEGPRAAQGAVVCSRGACADLEQADDSSLDLQ
eukprot:m51a1_g10398 hypothetical protein (236) ;mRNA; f:67740-68802